MKTARCIACGMRMSKSALTDPFMCRTCEQEDGVELTRYAWLDNQ